MCKEEGESQGAPHDPIGGQALCRRCRRLPPAGAQVPLEPPCSAAHNPHSLVLLAAISQEYGSGRARLPGLEEMMAAMQSGGSSAGPNGNSSSGLAAPPTRPSSSSGSGQSTAVPTSSGSSVGDDAPSLGDYLKFGRLLGDKPQQVQQQLALGATRVVVDDQSANYLQVGCLVIDNRRLFGAR